MRYYNTSKDLKLYAVAGTQTVLLSFDIAKSKVHNQQFLGFWIERIDKNGNLKTLNGSKHFSSLINDNNITEPKVKYQSLIQSYYWHDYTADPNETYTYTVKPMFGTALHHKEKYTNSIVVTTEPLQQGMHSVYFNYGVTGSQAYATNKKFGNTPIENLKGKTKDEALAFLGRELWNEGLLKFVQQATNKNYSLYCAFYEFQYPEFLKEIKAAKQRGVQINIVVSGKEEQYKDKTHKDGTVRLNNETMIKKFGLSSITKLRTKPSQPHNKFMVLCQNGQPTQVWTGSTNITLAGIFGHCNTGHWVINNEIAEKYLSYWKNIAEDPTMSTQSKNSEALQPDTDLVNLKKGTYVFFSPRDLPTPKGQPPAHLKKYAELIDSAKEMVCMIFPFNMDDVFKEVYNKDKNYLRLLLFESAAQAKAAKSNDIDVKITAGAVLDSNVENFFKKEVTAKYVAGAGILYVHNKFFIIDALTNNPVVVTGSANFSSNSIKNNDENSMLIKGDKRVADIYLTEFDRLFVHFWPRYLQSIQPKNKKAKTGFNAGLDEAFTWHTDYYDTNKFGYKRKQQFNNMQGAKKG